MNVAELLLNLANEFNGHKQTTITGLTVEQGVAICKELEEFTSHHSSFVIELWTDGSFTIYEKDYWKEDRQGGRDRVILSTAN